MRFELPLPPTPKSRHRTSRGVPYDPQTKIKHANKWICAQIMRESGLKMFREPIRVELTLEVPMPKSWSQKRKKTSVGSFVPTKPDNDNYEKFYYDVLSGIAYPDDGLIALNWTQKIYADKPRVVIEINPVGQNMITEHAITYKDKLSADDLNYIIKKANRLGQMGRMIARVYLQEDDEGTHVYFEVEGMREKTDGS